MLEFEEDSCILTNVENGESQKLPKKLGKSGQPGGTYSLDNPGTGDAAWLVVEPSGNDLMVFMERWEGSGIAAGSEAGENRYIIQDRFSTLELGFQGVSCLISEEGEAVAFTKDPSRPVYGHKAHVPAPAGEVPGLYLAENARGGIPISAKHIGGNLLGFEFYEKGSGEDFGFGKPEARRDKRVIETSDTRFEFGNGELVLIYVAYDERMTFEKVTESGDDSGNYFATNDAHGFAMILSIEIQAGTYHMVGDLYERVFQFNAGINGG